MLAVVYSKKGEIKVKDVPIPKIKADEILLKVKTASICGTDIKIKNFGHFKNPEDKEIILGHEVSGEIAEVGENLSAMYRKGDRITLSPNIGCGVCLQCMNGMSNYCEDYDAIGISMDGAFAEYMRIPSRYITQGNIVLLPENVSFDEAALGEPLSTVVNGAEVVEIAPPDIVLIIGAGPMGALHIMMSKLRGAQKVIVSEISSIRSRQALDFGADIVVNPQTGNLKEIVMDLSYGRGASVIIIAAPSGKAQEESLELIARLGRINFFGGLPKGQDTINFKSNIVHYKQIMLTGTTGQSPVQFRKAIEIIASGGVDVNRLISARYFLKDAEKAFERARSEDVLKVVFNI